MANPLAKLELLLQLNNKLSGGLKAAHKQVKEATGGMQGKLDAFSRKHTQAFDAIKETVPGVGNAIGMLANPYVAVGAAVVAVGAGIVKCTKMAADWHEKMAEINVTAEQTPKELKKLSDEMLSIGARNANNLDEIPQAFSAIIGAIGDTDKSLATLEPVLRAAKAGFVDVETAARAATSIMGAAGVSGQVALDTIVAAVKEGNAGFADVANYMPKVIPLANQIGVSLGEVGGAFAQLTKSLKPEAAATALEGVMRAFSNDKVMKNFKGIGIDIFDTDTGKMRPIIEIMNDLNGQMNGLTDKQKTLKFGQLGLDQSATLGISSMMQNVEELGTAIDNVTNSTGTLEKAFEDAKTPMDRWRIIGNKLQVTMTKIGEFFLPIVETIAIKIEEVIQYFKDLYKNSVFIQDIFKGIKFVAGLVFKLVTLGTRIVIGRFRALGEIISFAWDKLKDWGVVDFFKKIYTGIRPYIIYIKELLGGITGIFGDMLDGKFKSAYKKFKNFKMPDLDEIKSRSKKQDETTGDFAGVPTDDEKKKKNG